MTQRLVHLAATGFLLASLGASGQRLTLSPAVVADAGVGGSIMSLRAGMGERVKLVPAADAQWWQWRDRLAFDEIWNDERGDETPWILRPLMTRPRETWFTITINFEATYEWNVPQWVTPVNVRWTQRVQTDSEPISVGAGARFYPETPQDGPEYGVRVMCTFVLP